MGKVNQDLTVKLLKATDFGLNFGTFAHLSGCLYCVGEERGLLWVDYNAANAVVDATHRYKDMFYAD